MYSATDYSLPGSLYNTNQSNVPSSFSFYTEPVFEATSVQRSWAVTVSVEGIAFSYQLTNDDLFKVFSRYGNVVHVDVVLPEGSMAYVCFSTHDEAARAIAALDGKELAGVKGHLRVTWGPMPDAVPTGSYVGGELPQRGEGVRKFTCRFEIGIENDREFQVARRIIGQKGTNMKNIVSQTDAKLRLRGRGSGYLEGLSRQESPEPLHLCISCTNKRGYHEAIRLVSELLEGVYEEYRQFCKTKGIPVPPNLKVTVREHPLSNNTVNNSNNNSIMGTPPTVPTNGFSAAGRISNSGSGSGFVTTPATIAISDTNNGNTTNPYLVTPSSTFCAPLPPPPKPPLAPSNAASNVGNTMAASFSPALGGLAVGIPTKTPGAYKSVMPSPQVVDATGQKENIVSQDTQ